MCAIELSGVGGNAVTLRAPGSHRAIPIGWVSGKHPAGRSPCTYRSFLLLFSALVRDPRLHRAKRCCRHCHLLRLFRLLDFAVAAQLRLGHRDTPVTLLAKWPRRAYALQPWPGGISFLAATGGHPTACEPHPEPFTQFRLHLVWCQIGSHHHSTRISPSTGTQERESTCLSYSQSLRF